MNTIYNNLIAIGVFLIFSAETHGQCEFEKIDSLDLSKVFLKYDISDYLNFTISEAPLDIVILSTSGGSQQFDYLRITKIDSGRIKIFNGDSTRVIERELDSLSIKGSYIGLCPYTSANNSVMACVKKYGVSIFTFHLIDGGIEQLPFDEYRILLLELLSLGKLEFNSP